MNALTLAIKAIERDIKRHEELAQCETLTDEESEYYGQYVLDLTQAIGELGSLYQSAREDHPDCPPLEDLTRDSSLAGPFSGQSRP